MSRTLQLYQLQTIDSEIDQTRQELAQLAAQLGESDDLKQAKTRMEITSQELRRAQTVMQDLDLELKSLATKTSNQEKKLYSGKMSSAKEASNLQDEVSSLKRRQADLEENLLEAMMVVEESEEAVETAQTRLSSITSQWSAGQEELLQEQDALNRRLAELKSRRPILAQPISESDLKLYEQMRPKKAGRAVVAVKGDLCQGCGIAMPSNHLRRARSGTEILTCPTCGRILYVP
ncbi:MAG: hypothetical protein KDJ65_03800 [Anaerolineae bacterium]|nr:hypothetical protein [Anaerolineae bacterium]